MQMLFQRLGLILVLALYMNHADAQNVSIRGTIMDTEKNPIEYATVSFPAFNLAVTTTSQGLYIIKNAPKGKVRMVVRYLGKQSVDTLVNVRSNMVLDFVMKEEDFHIKEVVVTAQRNAAGKATSSYINRNAIDHLQATSLSDLMALTPGGISRNQTLGSSQTLNLRQVEGADGTAMNSLGTAVIEDGAPLSNNANLSALNPTVAGNARALGGGASASTGIDIRSISTENIEGIEVIRGIPSVEYGDITSGAVIIHTKAGREPLRIKAKANPNVYQGSIGTGFDLGKRFGALNISGDYAYNTNKVTESYRNYQRLNAKAMYSNGFFGNRLRSNTSFSFLFGKDSRKPNPDDEIAMIRTKGETYGLTLNTNGLFNFDKMWLQNIKYVLSASYTSKNNSHQERYTSANSHYSGTYTDGAVLSNVLGERLYDTKGNEITNLTNAGDTYYAHYLSNAYIGYNEIDSREVNFFGKLSANFFKNFGQVNNGFLVGVDFKSDGNEGDGQKWSVDNPPYRNLSYPDASYRPRSYKDIPYIKTFGAFFEDNFSWNIASHVFNLQAGLRYDHTSVVGSKVSPRFNASFEVIPEIFTIRGGYGILAKLPTLYYLYPDKAYFEYVNLNEMANTNMPEKDRRIITTTKIIDSQNKDLKIATNRKVEAGFDLKIGKVSLSATGFFEKQRDGYTMGKAFMPFTVKQYERNEDGALALSKENAVLSAYNTPSNGIFCETKGVEFELNVGRIESIRTSFQLNGAWMKSKSWSELSDYYDNSTSEYSTRKNIAIYSPHNSELYNEQLVTTLRATHNIPSIGFVVTLTAQAIWKQSDYTNFYNDSIPVGYLSLEDGNAHYFKAGEYTNTTQIKEADMAYLLRNVDHIKAIKESISPLFQFNINVTKEISDIARISFFANNMFRSYPRRERKRYPGTYYTYNNQFFFGMELALKL